MHEEYIMDKLPPEVRADYLDRIHRFVLMDDTFMAKSLRIRSVWNFC